MVFSKKCFACGSTSAPLGARFCPDCGINLTDEPHVFTTNTPLPSAPLAPAVPISEQASAVPVSEAFPSEAANNAPITSESMVNSSMYFKNPSPMMLQRSTKHRMVGGILFIETSDPHGKFVVPKSITVTSVLSGSNLDFSMADFVYPETKIRITGGVLSDLKVTVPRGVAVETRGIGILGSFKGLKSQSVHAAHDGPMILVEGVTVLGTVRVVVNENVPPVKTIY